MAVRLPRLKQVQPTQSAPTDRIQGGVQDQSSSILGRTQAVTSIVKTGADIYQKYENDKIGQLTNDVEQKYKLWDDEKLRKLRSISPDVDPTAEYVKYDDEREAKLKEIMGEYPDLNERVRRNVTGNLSKIQDSYASRSMNQRGMQVETYKHTNHVNALKLKKRNLADQSAGVKLGEIGEFDNTLIDIKNEVARRGLDNGTVTEIPADSKEKGWSIPGPDGTNIKVKLSNSANLKVAAQHAEGVAFSLKSIIDSGDLKQAEVVFKKYGHFLDSATKGKLENQFKKEGQTQEAVKLAYDLGAKSSEEQNAALRKIKDDGLRSKTRDALITENNKIAKLRTQQEDKSGNKYLDIYDELKAAGQINGPMDLETHPALKNIWSNTSPAFKKSIKGMFKSVQADKSEDVVKAQEVLLGDLSNISRADFQQYITANMKETTKNTLVRQFMSKKSKPSDSFKTVDKAKDILKDLMFKENLLEFKEGRKLTDVSIKREQAAYAGLINYLEDIPGTVTAKELTEYVESYITKAKKQKLFGKAWYESIGDFTTVAKARAVPLTREEVLKGVTENEFRRYKMNYKNESGTLVRDRLNNVTNKDFLRFIENERGL